jgi:cysteine desulfuration protein SufE
MNGRTPEELAHIDLYFIDAIGLGENLSPTRSNGLRAMISQMKLDALVYTQQQNNAQL